MGGQACVSDATPVPALEKGPEDRRAGRTLKNQPHLLCAMEFGIGFPLDLKLGESWATLSGLHGTCTKSVQVSVA